MADVAKKKASTNDVLLINQDEKIYHDVNDEKILPKSDIFGIVFSFETVSFWLFMLTVFVYTFGKRKNNILPYFLSPMEPS